MAQGAQAEGIVALGETNPGFVSDEWAMVKGGRVESEGAIEQELTRSGSKEVFSADYLSDFHCSIVHDDSQMIRGNIVVAPNDKISEVNTGSESLRAVMAIGESDCFAIGNAEAPVDARCRLQVENCKFRHWVL